MAEPAEKHMSLAAFLEWDDGTVTRYELIDGRPRAMARRSRRTAPSSPTSPAISAIGCSLPAVSWSRRGSSPPTAPIPGIRPIWSSPAPPPSAPPAPSPRLIVEVLAPSTAAHDRGVKLADYFRTVTVERILMIASEDRHVEVWLRAEDAWKVQDLIGAAAIPIAIDGQPLPLTAIYDGAAL